MTTKNCIDAGYLAGKFQIDIHAVVGKKQHGIRPVLFADRSHQWLQLLRADTECPVGYEARRIRDRRIRERLSDDRDRAPGNLAQRKRRKDVTAVLVIGRHAFEQSIVGESDILRDELAREGLDIFPDLHILVGELPVPGHDIDAEQVTGAYHVLTARPQCRAGALPGIAAIE